MSIIGLPLGSQPYSSQLILDLYLQARGVADAVIFEIVGTAYKADPTIAAAKLGKASFLRLA